MGISILTHEIIITMFLGHSCMMDFRRGQVRKLREVDKKLCDDCW